MGNCTFLICGGDPIRDSAILRDAGSVCSTLRPINGDYLDSTRVGVVESTLSWGRPTRPFYTLWCGVCVWNSGCNEEGYGG